MLLLITREEKFVFIEKSLVTRHFNSVVPEPEDTSSVQEICLNSSFWKRAGTKSHRKWLWDYMYLGGRRSKQTGRDLVQNVIAWIVVVTARL